MRCSSRQGLWEASPTRTPHFEQKRRCPKAAQLAAPASRFVDEWVQSVSGTDVGGIPWNMFTPPVWLEHTLYPRPPTRKEPRDEGPCFIPGIDDPTFLVHGCSELSFQGPWGWLFSIACSGDIGGIPWNVFTPPVWLEYTLHPRPQIRKEPRAEGPCNVVMFSRTSPRPCPDPALEPCIRSSTPLRLA